MLNPESMRRFSSLGLFILPILAVKVAEIVAGGSAPTVGSATAAVGDAASAAATTALTNLEWSASQRLAAEHVRKLVNSTFGPVPMLYTAKAVVIQPKPPEPAPEPPREPDIPTFTLQAVMAAPSGDKALINGRMYEIGQQIRGVNWVLQTLDIDNSSAVLAEQNSTRTVTISVHR